ncbi:MAG: glycosyltransferase family 39 protein [Chloroflexi bacterium]|nr:glycosyltransferase family 39 protein [Chloroflexota bacterium]
MDARPLTPLVFKHKERFWLLVSLAFAFALRVYLLAGQSLWNDEGTSVALSSLSPEAIIAGAAHDIHPPLYYLLLHFWMLAAGQTEFAVRFLSVGAGVLVVAVSFRFALFFFEEEVAIIAAFLCAFSPFQVDYSQETRMYIWVALFGAVAALAVVKMLGWQGRDGPSQALDLEREPVGQKLETRARNFESGFTRYVFWFVYFDATVAALYTHYFAASVLVFENLIFGFWFLLVGRKRQGRRATFLAWVVTQALIVLAFVPWYLYTRAQLAAWPAISEPFDLPTLVWRALNVFSVGKTLDPSAAFIIVVAFAILALAGLVPGRERRDDFGALSLLAWTLAPLGVLYVISLSRPAYDPKFLLLAVPPFLILVARGVARIYQAILLRGRHSSSGRMGYAYLSIAALAAMACIPALRNYYEDPRYARDDYRAILEEIDQNEKPGDGILVDAMGQIDVVKYYHRGHQALYLLPRMRPPDPQETRADVDDMLGKVGRLFAIYWATAQSDPQGIVESRLAQKAFKAEDRWYGDVRLALYGVGAISQGSVQKSGVKVGDEITLESFWLGGGEANGTAHRGDIVLLSLNWRADRSPTGRYKVFVHLLDSDGRVVAQRDGEPVGDTRITTSWRAGEAVEDHYGVLIPAQLPAGEYRIEVGMYRADNGARLAMTDAEGQALGDHLILGSVRVIE